MPWNYDDAQINGIIDSNIKDSPPNAPMINTASIIRSCLKLMWQAMRGQVSNAVIACDATTASLVTRSLNLTATIYVDGVNGNDARTGTTDDNNAATGRVKTLYRVAQLHSGKTYALTINIINVLDINSFVYIACNSVSINILSGGVLRFKKFNTAGVGDGTWRIELQSTSVSVYINAGGTLEVEAHSGTAGMGDQFFYRNIQGAIGIIPANDMLVYPGDFQTVSLRNSGTFIIGNNTTFCTSGRNGTNRYGSVRALYWRGYGSPPTLGTNALESDLIGDRTFLRSYHPTSSTDGGVMEGETVISPTNKKLWTKQGGTIRDAMGTTFV